MAEQVALTFGMAVMVDFLTSLIPWVAACGLANLACEIRDRFSPKFDVLLIRNFWGSFSLLFPNLSFLCNTRPTHLMEFLHDFIHIHNTKQVRNLQQPSPGKSKANSVDSQEVNTSSCLLWQRRLESSSGHLFLVSYFNWVLIWTSAFLHISSTKELPVSLGTSFVEEHSHALTSLSLCNTSFLQDTNRTSHSFEQLRDKLFSIFIKNAEVPLFCVIDVNNCRRTKNWRFLYLWPG